MVLPSSSGTGATHGGSDSSCRPWVMAIWPDSPSSDAASSSPYRLPCPTSRLRGACWLQTMLWSSDSGRTPQASSVHCVLTTPNSRRVRAKCRVDSGDSDRNRLLASEHPGAALLDGRPHPSRPREECTLKTHPYQGTWNRNPSPHRPSGHPRTSSIRRGTSTPLRLLGGCRSSPRGPVAICAGARDDAGW